MAVKILNGIDVDGSMNIAASDVPNLDASKITSGTLSADRIPNLSGVYQPAGDYLTLETAETTFQPLGNYLTSVPAEYLTQTEGDARYLRLSGGTLTGNLTAPSFTGRLQGGLNGAPDATIWCVSGEYTDWGIFYDEGSPDKIHFKSGGVSKANIALDTGVITTTQGNSSQWSTAYTWGNHASVGYLTSLPSHNHDTLYDAIGSADAVNLRIDEDVLPAIPTNNNQLTNGAGYLTTSGKAADSNLLDGLDSGSFLRSNANDIATGHYIFSYNSGVTGSSAPSYTQGSIEIFADGPNVPAIGFHRGGQSATSLYEYDGQLYVKPWTTRAQEGLLLSSGNIGSYGFATQSYVTTQINNVIDSAPGALNTLNELAAALGDDVNFSTTITNQIAAVDERINTEVFDAIATVDGNIPTNNNQLTNGAGYITDGNTNWNNSYGFITASSDITGNAATATTATNLGTSYTADTWFRATGDDNTVKFYGNSRMMVFRTDGEGGDTGHTGYAFKWTYGGDGTGATRMLLDNNGELWTSSYGWLHSRFETAGAADAVNLRIDSEVLPLIDTKADASHTHSAADITSGTLSNDRLNWNANDDFSGTYSLLWNASNSLYTASWLTIRGSDDTLFTRSISANGKLSVGNGMWVNGNNATVYNNYNENLRLPPAGNNVSVIAFRATGEGGVPSSSILGFSDRHEVRIDGTWRERIYAGTTSINNTLVVYGDAIPDTDRTRLLGRDTNRWQVVFCEILDSAGLHEKNLQNPEGEKSVGDYATGTVLVWKGGKNVPCTEPADHMRMGIAVKDVSSPLVQGAEPVLVTGIVKEGDYLVTSSVEGHAKAISPQFMRQHGLYDCVLGKALENGEGESYLLKTWINI